MDTIKNKVAQSGLITLDLEELQPNWEITGFDMSDVLFEGLVLREKDYREFIKTNDWSQFEGKHVFVTCSSDAIVPTWAYMLLSVALTNRAISVHFGTRQDLEKTLWLDLISKMNFDRFIGQRVIVKGCSSIQIDETIYMELTKHLKPLVKSLMFGEPCSTVPLYKQKA